MCSLESYLSNKTQTVLLTFLTFLNLSKLFNYICSLRRFFYIYTFLALFSEFVGGLSLDTKLAGTPKGLVHKGQWLLSEKLILEFLNPLRTKPLAVPFVSELKNPFGSIVYIESSDFDVIYENVTVGTVHHENMTTIIPRNGSSWTDPVNIMVDLKIPGAFLEKKIVVIVCFNVYIIYTYFFCSFSILLSFVVHFLHTFFYTTLVHTSLGMSAITNTIVKRMLEEGEVMLSIRGNFTFTSGGLQFAPKNYEQFNNVPCCIGWPHKSNTPSIGYQNRTCRPKKKLTEYEEVK